MSLARLVAFVEDSPWCGTALVHPAHPGRLERPLAFQVVNEVALNPQPLPPHSEIAARLWQAIRLHQYAHMLATDKRNVALEESLSQAAVRIYDDWDMPNLPWMIVLRWLGRPPPPPPPWLEVIGQAAAIAMIGTRMGGDFGEQLRSAASAVILERVGTHAAS